MIRTGRTLVTLAAAFGFLLGLLIFPPRACSQNVTLTGTIQASNGLPSSNFTISFTPTQFGFVAGTGVVVNSTTFCGTGTDGHVTEFANPLTPTVNTASYSGGSLPAGNYYVEYTFYTSTPTETIASPESTAQLTATGNLVVAAPVSGIPAGSLGMKVYIGTSSGSETFQGETTGSGHYTQSTALSAGANPPSTNNTVCTQVANDAIWPVGTAYTVSLSDPSGNVLPGYPMQWQLLGPGTTINLSNGLPYYHGVVTYPVPILASPQSHANQSISGPLSLTGYNLVNVGNLGVGTAFPGWGVDVEGSSTSGLINAKGGYLLNGSGGSSGQCLLSDGTAYDTPSNCLTSATLFYQTVDANAVAQTQRPSLNFSSNFALTDSSSPARTNVDLGASGVTAGSYTAPNITVDAYGRITSATNSSSGGTNTFFSVTGCSPSTSTDSSCTGTIGLSPSQPDTSYYPFLQINSINGAFLAISVSGNLTTTSFPYTITCTFNCSSIVAPTVYVYVHHN